MLHPFWVGKLRLVLDVQVSSGKQHTRLHAKAAWGRLLDELGDQRQSLVRGDSGYGYEGILLEWQGRNQAYLLRLPQTAHVQRLVERPFARSDWSRSDHQGGKRAEDGLPLHGWRKKRRGVMVRQRLRGGVARKRSVNGKQLRLDLGFCQNGFDELKNQWGLSGFTTQDINRCQTTARTCALVYNGWSWYCRTANPSARMEAITSRPLWLGAVGTVANHAGQSTLYLSALHGKAHILKPLIANIRAALQHVKDTAQQFKLVD